MEVSRETVAGRILLARRQALVLLAFRMAGGGIVTFAVTWAIVAIALRLFVGNTGPVELVLAGAVSAALVLVARFTSPGGVPEAASKLDFLGSHAFVWADPFRDERPRFLPVWLEMLLWAPNQFVAGLEPFLVLRTTGQADAEAAADAARSLASGEMDLSAGLDAGSAESRGLRLLLLLRLARLVAEDGRLVCRISGLGQAVLFEGPAA